jgi:hypothetical protein
VAAGSPDGYTSDYMDELIREAEAEIYATSDDGPSDGKATDRCVVMSRHKIRSCVPKMAAWTTVRCLCYCTGFRVMHGTVQPYMT